MTLGVGDTTPTKKKRVSPQRKATKKAKHPRMYLEVFGREVQKSITTLVNYHFHT